MFRKISIVLLSTVMASCASTSLMDSWKETGHDKSYQHPMIIGISDSQQTRQIYEKHFVENLKRKNITATPSYTLISSKQKISRETVVKSIEGTDIDSVLVTYLVSADAEMKYRDSPMSTGYSGNVENNQISATIVSKRGQSRNEEIYVLKNDLYDVKSKSLVWAAQTKTVGPESVDQVVEEVIELLIDKMLDDGMIR